ncbi:MAG: ABC transporter ATP-binding protein/permease [Oscillospiraceae bacterium]|nr:ABC transporter ATP-binding protein/permease [Oscillospiraceae bacterium]
MRTGGYAAASQSACGEERACSLDSREAVKAGAGVLEVSICQKGLAKMDLPWEKGRFAMLAAAAKGRRLRFAVSCAATLLNVFFYFVSPQIIRVTIDSIIGLQAIEKPRALVALIDALGGVQALRDNLWICVTALVAAAVLTGVFNFLRRYYGLEISEHVAQNLRNQCYKHIQQLPWEWHVGSQTGDIIQRCTSDVDTIRNFIHNHFIELLRIIAVFAASLAVMFSMDVFMSLMSLALIPVILLFSFIYFKRIVVQFGKADEAEGDMQACTQENYTGVRVVRAFGRERFEVDRFKGKTQKYTDIWVGIGKMLGNFWGIGDAVTGLQLAIVVGAGVFRCAAGDLTPGTFFAFYTYCNMMIWPVRQLGRIISEFSKAAVSAGRIRDILSAKPERDPEDAVSPEIKGEIAFENVSFSYGGNTVLKNLSFTLKPGKTLAVLGATGSGKSSLVHLLSRLYDLPEGSGRITADGVDIRDISRAHLRKSVGLCLQEPFLFSKTIRENIAATRPDASLEDVRAAARTACIDEAITSFADGYDTIVGERGVTLSGGQKQRVAMARMLLAGTPIMVFDDSLSAVDTETDARIRAALKTRTKDAAVVIISHRTSTLMQADEILVLRDGEAKELGTHAELMALGGDYRKIFDLQGSVADELEEDA